MPIYHLSPIGEPSLWTGPRRPTQAEIDAVLAEHFPDEARTTVLELRQEGCASDLVAHDDYDGPAENDDWSGGFAENH